MPEVSIIVPVYGVERYIGKCIESILDQSFNDLELILVDDGSLDDSGNICDGYAQKDCRVKVIHSPNRGVSHARNLGIESAKGRFISFIDGDDWVDPDYLTLMLKWANDYNTVVYGNVINDYSDGSQSNIVFDYMDGDIVDLNQDKAGLVKYKILENGFPVGKLFVRNVIIENNLKFDESLSYHEDHLFVLDYLSHAKRIALSSFPAYHYEHRSGHSSLSKKRHGTLMMVNASFKLIEALNRGNFRWQIEDSRYLKRLYTFLGLNQLMIALRDASSDELRLATDAIRKNRKLFQKYYTPNHSIWRIVPYIINLHLEFPYKFYLRWKESRL